MLHGIAASSGVGVGNALIIFQEQMAIPQEKVNDTNREKYRFLEASSVFVDEIRHASNAIRIKAGDDEADILRTQIEMIRDPEFNGELTSVIEERGVNLEYAFSLVCNKYIKLFSLIEDEFLRARTADFIDFREHMLSILLRVQKVDLSIVPSGTVLVASDISPSCAASIEKDNVMGIVTETGTINSHIAIIARAMGLPIIVAVKGLLDTVRDGDTLLVNADTGQIVRNQEPKKLRRHQSYYSVVH
ncbi:MAG: hypothetical protein LBV27_06585 [Oscillospiraceae bacterium]|jgi:phosphotransferase system enzyme I (PtsI)|nr:hypothetical protein [Oscillospiraceae bacterium]